MSRACPQVAGRCGPGLQGGLPVLLPPPASRVAPTHSLEPQQPPLHGVSHAVSVRAIWLRSLVCRHGGDAHTSRSRLQAPAREGASPLPGPGAKHPSRAFSGHCLRPLLPAARFPFFLANETEDGIVFASKWDAARRPRYGASLAGCTSRNGGESGGSALRGIHVRALPSALKD